MMYRIVNHHVDILYLLDSYLVPALRYQPWTLDENVHSQCKNSNLPEVFLPRLGQAVELLTTGISELHNSGHIQIECASIQLQ